MKEKIAQKVQYYWILFFCHRIIEYFTQKFFCDSKVPSFGFGKGYGTVLPESKFFVPERICLILQSPFFLQNFANMSKIRTNSCAAQAIQRIYWTYIDFLKVVHLHNCQKDAGQFLFNPVPVVHQELFQGWCMDLSGGEPHSGQMISGKFSVLKEMEKGRNFRN